MVEQKNSRIIDSNPTLSISTLGTNDLNRYSDYKANVVILYEKNKSCYKKPTLKVRYKQVKNKMWIKIYHALINQNLRWLYEYQTKQISEQKILSGVNFNIKLWFYTDTDVSRYMTGVLHNQHKKMNYSKVNVQMSFSCSVMSDSL